jgi:hypothetical protein
MTAWLDFVKQYAKENNMTYKQAMTDAKQHYTKKVKLNIIEDEPIRRPAIEPPEPQTRELTETKDYKLQFAKKRRRLTKKQQRKKPPSYPPTIIEGQPKKKKLIFPTPYRKVKLNIIEDDAAAIELPKIEPPALQTQELTETIETTNEPIPQKVRKSRKVKLNIIEDEPIPQKVRKSRKVKLNIIEDEPTIPSSPYKNIIEEWDTVNLPYVIYQQQPKIYDAIEKKILTLAKKKSSVVIPDLLFFIKPFLNELFVHYGSNKTALDIIQNGMANLVINMGYNEDKVFKDNTEYIGKHFNKTNKEIIYKLLK